MQKELDKAIDYYASLPDSEPLNRNTFKMATNLRMDLVLSDGRGIPLPVEGLTGFGSEFLGDIATPPPAVQTIPSLAESQLLPIKIPDIVKRRILVAPLPSSDSESDSLFVTAQKKGFTEIWFNIPPNDAATKQLAAAITAGKARKMPIGAVVSWLDRRAADEQREADRNIFGETGDEWLARYTPPEATPSGIEKASGRELQHDYRELYTGNLVPGSEVTARRCVALAKIEGLSALVLEDAILPGWGGWLGSSDGLDAETRFGYSTDTRIACIRAKGFDPVDIAEYASYAKISPSEDFVENPATRQDELAAFRRQRNAAYLQTVFTRLHGAAPQLPLYIADAGSADTGIHRTYFMRWTTADKTPMVFSGNREENARASIQQLSPEALRASGTVFRKFQETFYWYLVTEETKSAAQWQGYVLNAGHDSPEEIQSLLANFADVPKGVPTKRKGKP